jgi:cytochrome b pre-mRNA-processing protein 3
VGHRAFTDRKLGKLVLLERLFGRSSRRRRKFQAAEAYVALVDAARRPAFYTDVGVPDTTEGRYELVMLHAFLILDRLQWHSEAPQEASEGYTRIDAATGESSEFAQNLFDHMFADMDYSLREMGVGDLGVGKRVRRMAEAFYGRALNYQRALDGEDDEALKLALRRNLFNAVEAPSDAKLASMAQYLKEARRRLRDLSTQDIQAARFSLPLPTIPE